MTQPYRQDPDHLPFTDEQAEAARIVRRRPGVSKVSVTIRPDEDLVEAFKARGEGYQTRINDALREYVALRRSSDDPLAALDKVEVLLSRVRQQIAA